METTFQVEPMGAVRQSRSDAWRPRDCVVRYRAYRDRLRECAEAEAYEVPAVGLSITFVMTMPKSWSNKKRAEMLGKPHQSKPDLDNLIKGFKDALCEDDSYVWKYGEMVKLWGEVGQIVIKTPIPAHNAQG